MAKRRFDAAKPKWLFTAFSTSYFLVHLEVRLQHLRAYTA